MLGFNNGVFDLNVMEFRKGQAQDYISSYMIDGYKHLEYMWFLTGIGRNSKGVFTTLLTKTLGDYAYCPKVEIFMDEKASSSSGPTSEVAKMKGKRCIANKFKSILLKN